MDCSKFGNTCPSCHTMLSRNLPLSMLLERWENMKKLSLALHVFLLSCGYSAGVVFNKVPNIESARIRKVAVSQTNPSFMAVASDNALYIGKPDGSDFRKAIVLKDEKTAHVFIDQTLVFNYY